MSESNFDAAMDVLYQHEGGYSDDPSDHGGATKFGISLRFMKLIGYDTSGDGHINKFDVRILSKRQATEIYRERFWEYYNLDQINDEGVAIRAMSFFVNMRGRTAAKIIQRALIACDCVIKDDGVIGAKSITAINSTPPSSLIPAIRSEAAGVYRRIAARDASQLRFLRGWLKRAYY